MSRGYRCAVIALVGCLTLGAAPSERKQTAPEQQQPSQEIADALKGIDATLQKEPEPDVTAKPCGKGEEDRQSDLCAQWNAADAARSAARAAWVFGVLGSIIGVATLVAAILAAKYAKDAAKETKRSADVAVADSRPWIAVEVKPTGNVYVRDGVVWAPVQLDLMNIGGTPAEWVCYGMNGATHPYDNADYKGYWIRAEQAAREQADANIGVTIFPGKSFPAPEPLGFIVDLVETEGGYFTISFGAVVTYRWGEKEAGKCKIAGKLVITEGSDEGSGPPDWRFNLESLALYDSSPFVVQRITFIERYT